MSFTPQHRMGGTSMTILTEGNVSKRRLMASVARIAAVDPRFEAEEGVFPAQRSPWMTDIRKSEGRAKQRMKQRKGRYSSLLEKCQGELKETKALLKHNEQAVVTLEEILSQSRREVEESLQKVENEQLRASHLEEEIAHLKQANQALIEAAALFQSGDLQTAYISVLNEKDDLKSKLMVAQSLISSTLAVEAVSSSRASEENKRLSAEMLQIKDQFKKEKYQLRDEMSQIKHGHIKELTTLQDAHIREILLLKDAHSKEIISFLEELTKVRYEANFSDEGDASYTSSTQKSLYSTPSNNLDKVELMSGNIGKETVKDDSVDTNIPENNNLYWTSELNKRQSQVKSHLCHTTDVLSPDEGKEVALRHEMVEVEAKETELQSHNLDSDSTNETATSSTATSASSDSTSVSSATFTSAYSGISTGLVEDNGGKICNSISPFNEISDTIAMPDNGKDVDSIVSIRAGASKSFDSTAGSEIRNEYESEVTTLTGKVDIPIREDQNHSNHNAVATRRKKMKKNCTIM